MANNVDLNDKDLGRTRATMKASQSVSPTNYAIFQSRQTMETYLLANGWTQKNLDTQTHNDLVFEIRNKLGAAVNYQP